MIQIAITPGGRFILSRNLEKTILKAILVLGTFSFFQLLRKPPVKDWLLIFFLKSYIASILDTLLVKKGYLKYPVSLSKTFDISVLFSYLIFPVTCIYFNQATKNSGPLSTLWKLFLFTAPSTIVESWLEKNTKLIRYKKNWTSYHSFFSIGATFLAVKWLMAVIRKLANKQKLNI
jgi:hypothetical protein